MAVEFRKKSIWIVAVLLASAFLAGCNGGSYAIKSGSINIYNDSMEGEYKSFSGHFYKEIKLEKGEIIRFCMDEKTDCGNLSFGLEDGEGNIIAELEDGYILQAPEAGSYRIFARGDKHGGGFCLSWVSEPEGNPSEAVEVDNVESFIYQRLSGEMTPPEEIEVIHQLQFVDWVEFSALGEEPIIDLLDWLHGLEAEKKIPRLPYIFSIEGLDGAYAEYYELVIGELFIEDPESFVLSVKCLDREDEARTMMFVNNYLKYTDETGYMDVLEEIAEKDPEASRILREFLEIDD